MEDYAYIIDYLPQGLWSDKNYVKGPIAYSLGESEFKLLELVPKKDAKIAVGDRVYIGKDMDLRREILHVKRRIGYKDLTTAAQNEISFVIQKIVEENEKRFVTFFNDAQAITTRFHMLELLPGLGKKSMWAIINERKKSAFQNFGDIEERTGTVHHPEKLIARRIELELSEPEQKYHLFVVK